MTATAGYVRESTIAQGEKYGPDAQRTAIARACADLALGEPAHWYSDLVSGTGALKRSDFQRMIADARAGAFTILVAYDTSRFARNEHDAFTYEAALHAAGARVYYAREGIWSDDRRGALQKGIFHVLNAQYSRDLSQRVRDGYAAKFAKAGHPGGLLPWGYRWSADATAVEIDAVEGPQRRALIERYATGTYSARTLADELTREGMRVRGRPVTNWTVYEVLRNPIAVGVTTRYRGRAEESRGAGAPALVSAATWSRVQDVLRSRRVETTRRDDTFAFAGRVVHAPCGRPLWARTQDGVARLAHSRPSCRERFISERLAIEETFAAWVAAWRLAPAHRTRVARFLREDRTDVDATVARRSAAEQRLVRARRLYLLGDIDEASYLVERSDAQRVLDGIRPPARAQALGALAGFAAAWPQASIAARRAFVREVVERIRVGADRLDVVIRPELRSLLGAIAPERDLWARRDSGHRVTLRVDAETAAAAERYTAWAAEATA